MRRAADALARIVRHQTVSLLGLGLALGASASALAATPIERELHIVATLEATQDWKKNDPEHPGEQWSKGSTTQRYEVRTRLRSDGQIELRHLLDPDLNTRLEAKTIHLARQAKKYLEKPGQPMKLPGTPEEKAVFMREMNSRLLACNAEPVCYQDTTLQYAAIMAAIDNPGVLEPDTEPGRYLYFLPYKGCPDSSRITLTVAIDGVRYNKDVDKFIPFKERHSADTIDASDGLPLCAHFMAVMDTQDPDKPMWQETIFIPRPEGITEYTENNHTSREKQYQPMPMEVIDWMNAQLRHARPEGEISATVPLVLPLNSNATWLGLWTGAARVNMKWSFREVPAASAAPVKP